MPGQAILPERQYLSQHLEAPVTRDFQRDRPIIGHEGSEGPRGEAERHSPRGRDELGVRACDRQLDSELIAAGRDFTVDVDGWHPASAGRHELEAAAVERNAAAWRFRGASQLGLQIDGTRHWPARETSERRERDMGSRELRREPVADYRGVAGYLAPPDIESEVLQPVLARPVGETRGLPQRRRVRSELRVEFRECDALQTAG